MSKSKKKRTKRYQGTDAKNTRPQVIRVDAVKRSKPGQWWHDNKRRTYTILGVAVVILVLSLVITELFRIIF